MSMRIEHSEKDINFVAELNDRLCLLYMTSGEGKTLLFRTFNKAVYEPWHSRYHYYDYTTMDKVLDDTSKYLNPNNVIVFDNADLYRDSVLKAIKGSKATFVIITKALYWLMIYEDELGYYCIDHTSDYVMMREKNSNETLCSSSTASTH